MDSLLGIMGDCRRTLGVVENYGKSMKNCGGL